MNAKDFMGTPDAELVAALDTPFAWPRTGLAPLPWFPFTVAASAEDFENHFLPGRQHLDDLHAPRRHGIEELRGLGLGKDRLAFLEVLEPCDTGDALAILRRQPPETRRLAEDLVD